jgi:hypothetical protein
MAHRQRRIFEGEKANIGHPFRVGEEYGNRLGSYRVVSIDEPNMVVRYDDGNLLESDIATLARIWENMQIEAEAAKAPYRRYPSARERPSVYHHRICMMINRRPCGAAEPLHDGPICTTIA